MKKKKILALSLALATAMLLPTNMMAQGGMFGTQNPTENQKQGGMLGKGKSANNGVDWQGGMLGKGRSANNGMVWQGGGMTTQDPTQEVPLGSGLLILAMAGVGYAIVDSKKGKENLQ